MKATRYYSAFALLSVFFLLSSFTTKLSAPPCNCDNSFGSGCAGACGAPTTISGVVASGPGGGLVRLICLSQTGSSLCPNTSCVYTVSRGGTVIWTGTLNTGDCFQFKALVGSTVSVTANLGPGSGGIDCIWLGETYFDFGYGN